MQNQISNLPGPVQFCLIFSYFAQHCNYLMIIINQLQQSSVNILFLTHKRQSCHHIETSQFICYANQLTRFYMIGTLTFNELRQLLSHF